MKFLVVVLAIAAAVRADDDELFDKLKSFGFDVDATPFEGLPRPEDLVYDLSEDEFQTYLDFWLSSEQAAKMAPAEDTLRATCSVSVSSLGEPQPVYVAGGRLLAPTGNGGVLQMSDSQPVSAICAGSGNGLSHSSTSSSPVSSNLVCQSGSSFSSPGWLSGQATFGDVKCKSHPPWLEARGGSCSGGRGVSIAVGVQGANGQRYDTLTSCFRESNLEAIFVTYDQTPENAGYQSSVARPNFQQGQWYPGLNVDNLYTQNSQKAAIASVVGSALADVYVNSTYFLARGHLAAKTDFVLAASQRATFTFINCIPQWQPFNGGNWNTLEQNLRTRIGAAGYRTKVYTGAWDILKLKDGQGVGRDIYLDPSGRKIPVPLWMYKVVHDTATNRATAFLGLNNMHVSLAEAKSMAFCTDRCLGNSAFSWLNWQQENMRLGYTICCDVNDFRRTVDHLPAFTVSGLLS